MSDHRAGLRAVIAADKRLIRRYTCLLWFNLRASRAERARWRALREAHRRYVAEWQKELRG